MDVEASKWTRGVRFAATALVVLVGAAASLVALFSARNGAFVCAALVLATGQATIFVLASGRPAIDTGNPTGTEVGIARVEAGIGVGMALLLAYYLTRDRSNTPDLAFYAVCQVLLLCMSVSLAFLALRTAQMGITRARLVGETDSERRAMLGRADGPHGFLEPCIAVQSGGREVRVYKCRVRAPKLVLESCHFEVVETGRSKRRLNRSIRIESPGASIALAAVPVWELERFRAPWRGSVAYS